MPIIFCKPTPKHCKIISKAENRTYWSELANIWLRKWGIAHAVSFEDTPLREGFYIVARKCHHLPPSLNAFWEGPINHEILNFHRVKAELRSTKSIILHLTKSPLIVAPGTWPLDKFGRPIEQLRRIPKHKKDISLPYTFNANGDKSSSLLIYQKLSVPDGWYVLAWVSEEEGKQKYPTIISNGISILSGLPILDMCVEKMSMPDCKDGYYAPHRKTISWQKEEWLANILIRHAVDSGTTVIHFKHWPGGQRAAFTIRHDYDREISDKALNNLLSVYQENKLYCSIGFLVRLLPIEQIQSLTQNGHEIVLHSEAANEHGLKKELESIKQNNISVSGVSCHGGIGSAGHLGGTLFQWCHKNKLKYTEQLGRDNFIPHPALVENKFTPTQLDCMIMSSHRSLDTGTAPLAHAYANLRQDTPIRLNAGGVVNIMNHPDIHITHLIQLIKELDLDNVWCSTHKQIIDWCQLTKYDPIWSFKSSGLHIKFSKPLPEPLHIEVLSHNCKRLHIAHSGSKELTISET